MSKMTEQNTRINLEFSRRKLLAAAGLGSGAVIVASLMGTSEAQTAPTTAQNQPRPAILRVGGFILQFGADASTEVTVSWHTLRPVNNPKVVLGRLDGKFEKTVDAQPTSYTDAKMKQAVYAHHAKLTQLEPNSVYMYGAMHDGAAPEFGTFHTSPRGRASFTFTSFGDQGTPTVGKKFDPPVGEPPSCGVCQRQSGIAGGQRHDARRRTSSAIISPVQRRPLLRQYCRKSGAGLVGFLGKQYPQCAQPSLDALGGQS